MKITEENKYELIDKFAKGLMSEDDSTQFQSMMESDKDLFTEFNLIKELHEVQEFSIQEQKLRQTFESFHKPKKRFSNYLKYFVAFLVMGILGMLLYITIYNASLDQNRNVPLAMLEPLELITKSNDVQTDVRMMQELYNAQKYNEAMPYLLNHLENNPRDLDVLLAKGISLMETKEYSEAHDVFNKIESLNPRVEKYAYYKGITFMKEGDNSKAKKIFQDIVSTQSFGYEHAGKLLKSIN